jgi:hypothetical protein
MYGDMKVIFTNLVSHIIGNASKCPNDAKLLRNDNDQKDHGAISSHE